MFAGFNLNTSKSFEIFHDEGKKIFHNNVTLIQEELNRYILEDGSISGTEMQNNWFPEIDADIFISHSHANLEQAIALAGWLKSKFGLKAFIDSCVWGHADDLLKEIDNKYCKNPNGLNYNYKKRNFSTSHVHMMLSTALTMMIDKCECLLFLNTPQSLDTDQVINQTKSPWIYHEIAMTQLVRKKKPQRNEVYLEKKAFNYESAQESLTIKYDLNMTHLKDIAQIDLNNWERVYKIETTVIPNQFRHPLDILYSQHKLLKEEFPYETK